MIFQNSAEIDIFVKNELEDILVSKLTTDYISDDDELHNLLYKFIMSGERLADLVTGQTADLSELKIHESFRNFSKYVNFNPSFTFQICTSLFRNARIKLSPNEYKEYRLRVQKHVELIFYQLLLCNTSAEILKLERENNIKNNSAIDDLIMRGFETKEKLDVFLNLNPMYKKFSCCSDFDECIKSYENEKVKRYVSLTTANRITFYRDLRLSDIISNVISLYVNIYISYFNENDNQGLSSVNNFLFWYVKERKKYKKNLHYLFDFVVTCCLFDFFINVGLIFDMARDLINHRKSITCDIDDFYFTQKNNMLTAKFYKSLPSSIRLDINMLDNPLNESILGKLTEFSITKQSPENNVNFNTQSVKYDLNNDVVLHSFNPKNLYHVFHFLAFHLSRSIDIINNTDSLLNRERLRSILKNYFKKHESGCFNINTRNYESWYLNLFFKTFVLDNEVLQDEVMVHVDNLMNQLDQQEQASFQVNFSFAKILWFAHQKHKFLLEVLDELYEGQDQFEDEDFARSMNCFFGYLIHLESVLDHLMDLQSSEGVKNWINSFIPKRLHEVLEFESQSQYEDWLSSILDCWEFGVVNVYNSRIFKEFHYQVNLHNTLLWFPLFNKKTFNFDYNKWRNMILADLIAIICEVDDTNPDYWFMGEYLLDCAIIDLLIDYKDHRDKAKAVYELFIQGYNYNEYLDFNNPVVINNAKALIAKMQPYDETIIIPSYSTSILYFLENNKNRKQHLDVVNDSAFRVKVRYKTRLIVNGTFLGSPIFMSAGLKKTLESFEFELPSLFDPIKIQQTLLRYGKYIEVLKDYNLDLMAIFTMYNQECNLCFLVHLHDQLLLELKKKGITSFHQKLIVSVLWYIENSIEADCLSYANSDFERSYMAKKNRVCELDSQQYEPEESKAFFDYHYKILLEIYNDFHAILENMAEKLMIDLLIHINCNTEIDIVYCNQLIIHYQRVLRLTRNKITKHEKLTHEEQTACLFLFDFFHERACAKSNSAIITMNEKASSHLQKFKLLDEIIDDQNIIKFC